MGGPGAGVDARRVWSPIRALGKLFGRDAGDPRKSGAQLGLDAGIRGPGAAIGASGRRVVDTDGPRPLARGGVGDRIAAGILEDLDANPEVRDQKWYGAPGTIGLARKMERDPHVRASLASIIAPLRAATWAVRPASRSALDTEIADFVAHNLFERNPWDRTLKRQLRHLRDGFSLLEATDDMVPIATARFPLLAAKNGSKALCYTGFHHRPASTLYRWVQSNDEPEQLAGIEQWIVGSDGEAAGQREIPAARLIRTTQDQEGANFAGLPQLRSAYGAWKIKTLLMTLDAIRHERGGVGFPSLTLGEQINEGDEDRAEQILAEIRSYDRAYALLPHGWEFAWKTLEGNGTNIAEAIERCNRDIAFNVGAGFMLLGLTGNQGSFALAQSQQGQYEIQLDGHARLICEVWNVGLDGWSPIERIVRHNYGADVALPRLVARNMPTRDWSKILPVLNNLMMSRGIIPDDVLEDFLREVLTLPAADRATSRLMPDLSKYGAPVGSPPGAPGSTPPAPPPANTDDAESDDAEDPASPEEAA